MEDRRRHGGWGRHSKNTRPFGAALDFYRPKKKIQVHTRATPVYDALSLNPKAHPKFPASLAFSPSLCTMCERSGMSSSSCRRFYVSSYDMCWPSSPPRRASNARTSETYWSPSRRGTRCRRSLSVGSLIQPCIGMALSGERNPVRTRTAWGERENGETRGDIASR